MALPFRYTKSILAKMLDNLYRWQTGRILLNESKHPKFIEPNERIAEYAYALSMLMIIKPRVVLDVGPGLTSWPHLLVSSLGNNLSKSLSPNKTKQVAVIRIQVIKMHWDLFNLFLRRHTS